MSIEDQFDWDAFHRDTRELSLEARGAWWDCLYKMRLSPTRGRVSMPLSSYSILFGKTNQVTQRVLNEIGMLKVGEVVTERNGNVTVINRRMYRRFCELEGNKHRQSVFRERHRAGERNGNVTQMLQSTKNTSSSSEEYINKDLEKKQKKRVEATRIPDPFPLTEEMIDWANANTPGLRLIEAHDRFVEYWTNNTTARAVKVNWQLTWRTGMKLALKWQDENRSKSSVGKFTPDPDHEEFGDCSTCDNKRHFGEWPNITDCPACVGRMEAK